MIHTQCNARYDTLEKETQIKISNLEECVRIKDRQHIIKANDDFIIFQNLQVQVEELKSVNESLNLSVEELSKARALAEATLRERDELVFVQCEKIRLLEEQCEPFYEVQSEFDLEKVHDTQDNSEKDLILSLQTQLKETAELVVHFSDEKYFAEFELNNLDKEYETKNCVLKDIDQMKSQVSELVEKLKISAQEMKQQIVMFEEDKRMFLAKNEFLEKMSSSMQKEYNDLLASNDVLKHRLETKFKFLKQDTSLEKMIEMIEKEYESNVSKISITSSTIETKNLELVKEMGDKVKRFDDEKKERIKKTKRSKNDQKPTRNESDKSNSEESAQDQSRINSTQQERKSKPKIMKPRTESDKSSKFRSLLGSFEVSKGLKLQKWKVLY
ncbi:hypothetical protein Tco_0929091 [Tanacetum coccineum]